MEMDMTALTRILGTAGLALGGALAAANAASAAVCEDFTLTAAQVAVFENGTWSHDNFTETGPGQFTITEQSEWPAQVSLILRWDVNPDAHAGVLQAASLGSLPVFLDYQYVGDGFGTSFGAVAQVNNVTLDVGVRSVYFEMGVVVPGCDLIRSALATLTVNQSFEIDPDRIPELACQGPGCDLFIRNPGDIVINPGFDPGRIQQVLPEQVLPGQGRTQQQGTIQLGSPEELLPQLQLRN
jgi:hypothetical protein